MNQAKMKSIPGWTIYVDEVSNGVFKVTLKDAYGRTAEVTADATDETIAKAISDAFDIEKQISKNWNRFLFDLCSQELLGAEIGAQEYNDKVFGSWYIETTGKRLVCDGKDALLIFQDLSTTGWIDTGVIGMSELRYSKFMEQISKLRSHPQGA